MWVRSAGQVLVFVAGYVHLQNERFELLCAAGTEIHASGLACTWLLEDAATSLVSSPRLSRCAHLQARWWSGHGEISNTFAAEGGAEVGS